MLGINNGRERLAKVVQRMGTLKIIAFMAWLLCGLYAISPWSLSSTGPAWRRLIIPIGMNIGLVAVAASLISFQYERKRVLEIDTAIELERIRLRDAQNIASRDALTAATDTLTEATRDNTEALILPIVSEEQRKR